MSQLAPGRPDQIAADLRAAFERRYAAPATVVGRAPGRVNLIGEHTDYNRGRVLPLALPHATYVAAAPRTDGRARFASLQDDATWEGTLAEAGPGGPTGWAAYAAGVLWALGEAGIEVPGVDVLVDGRVPLGAGLSSSAALECSVAVAVLALAGRDLDAATRRLAIDACIRAETEVAGAPTGGMDQTVAVLGEPGAALLVDFDTDETRPVPLALDGLTLLVTDTRVSHELTDGGYAARRADCEAAAAELGVPSLRQADLAAVERISDERVRARARHVVTETDRVLPVAEALTRGDRDAVAELFAASHASMRDDFEISCDELDAAVAVAVEAGAVGARMTGGGFGGSSVALVPDERVEAVMRAIDTEFALRGFAAPAHLVAVPSAGAGTL
ncbi:galactokinase [Nocardioides sp. zg-579]|uniref:Galactokinase n=1 Tax=Nocardioides marmotae TaxID=2663857 RepID=A0A6I3IZK8_9ACTN|nr:galactokinase [Nocardioides marmotae]MCR6030920.1 galactokinase [Gordonia jinghuaiqii]MTB94557.1 galactokinase [Nocardioides marmotae]QKE01429.1 galactokinase [Nocardioides marmotae]